MSAARDPGAPPTPPTAAAALPADADPRPFIGGRVHFILGPDTRNPGEARPAVIVRVFPQALGRVNLQVLTDELNDGFAGGLAWKTSVAYDPAGQPDTWHWPQTVR